MKPAKIVSTLAGRGIYVEKNLVKVVRTQLEKRKARGPSRAEIKVRTATILEQVAWDHISPVDAGRLIADPLAKFTPKPRPEPRPEPKTKTEEPKAKPLSWSDLHEILEALRMATGEERYEELHKLLRRLFKIQRRLPEITPEAAIATLVVETLAARDEADEETLAARKWSR